jgi:putative membrane protein
MSMREFFLPDAKKRVAQAVKDVEAKTAAEIVVAVRTQCGTYRQTDHLVGAMLAFATLLVLLFHPLEFSVDFMPLNVLVGFALGEALSLGVPAVRRALTSKKQMAENVRVAARAAFFDMGIARTTGRTGVLVLVSFFERRVEVVPDSGIHVAELGPGWAAALAALEQAIRVGQGLPEFLDALRSLGAPLAAALPVQPDDVNELPDEPEFA